MTGQMVEDEPDITPEVSEADKPKNVRMFDKAKTLFSGDQLFEASQVVWEIYQSINPVKRHRPRERSRPTPGLTNYQFKSALCFFEISLNTDQTVPFDGKEKRSPSNSGCKYGDYRGRDK